MKPAPSSSPPPDPPAPEFPRPLPRSTRAVLALLAAGLLACWVLPRFWYTRTASDQPAVWMTEVTNAPGWTFSPQSVDKAAESVLAADATLSGEYSDPEGAKVRLFTAKRFAENPNAIGLFVHTPDRCWTQAGWRIEPTAPDFVEASVGGIPVGIERRIFRHPSGPRELVYFFGLVGGHQLPYRLDHNLGVGQRLRADQRGDAPGASLRASDTILWRRVWDSFASRRRLHGPKEFIRISTPLAGENLAAADATLRRALAVLLAPQPFGERPNAPAGLPR
jgi:hypothetical protein